LDSYCGLGHVDKLSERHYKRKNNGENVEESLSFEQKKCTTALLPPLKQLIYVLR
jgi:hypothetical protein